MLNTHTYTFDEVMNQHKMFREHTEPFDTFRDRLHSALRIGRSIEVSTDDMIARFVAEYGEIWPEYPERYLSEIIWASKPDCGISTT